MICELLDLRCIFVNELIGSVTLSIIFAAILYLIIASKSRLGFETTIGFGVPLLLIVGIAVGGFSAIYAFTTLAVGLMLAWAFNKMIGNR